MDAQQQPGQDPAGGRTVIAENVVAKVAALAARAVDGVHVLGSGGARPIGAIRDAVGASDLTQGVRVEVGETQVAVDINMVAKYGVPLQRVANAVRAAVYAAVQELVGLDVIEVNVEINDVYISGPEAEKSAQRPSLTERLGAAVMGAPPVPELPPTGDTTKNGEQE